ncbi:MAG: replisome organizer [Minisyncoccia bacterium]
MANHRMFSNRIANSAKFLQMPSESQLLYFHMVLRADDDGVVEAYPLVKLLSVAPDSFKVLLAKNFIKQLNEDQVIVVIDWLEHNTIRADRKVDSIYKQLLLDTIPDIKLIEPKPRSDVEDNSKRIGGLSMVSLSKGKLSKDNINNIPHKKYGEYKHVLLTDIEKQKLKDRFGAVKAKQLVTTLDEGIELKGYKYKNHYLAILKWESSENKKLPKNINIYDKAKKLDKIQEEKEEENYRKQNEINNDNLKKINSLTQTLKENMSI